MNDTFQLNGFAVVGIDFLDVVLGRSVPGKGKEDDFLFRLFPAQTTSLERSGNFFHLG